MPSVLSSPHLISTPRLPRNRLWTAAVWLLVVTSFLPYAAIPVGTNTNVPISSLVSLFVLGPLLRRPLLLIGAIAFALVPTVASLGGLFTYGASANGIALGVWVAQTIPFAAFASVALHDPKGLLAPLRFGLVVSILYSLVQKFLFLDNGTIPFLDLYNVPGYASVSNNAVNILSYIKRPFGWFPEPSFLAGTLALGAAALIVVVAANSLLLARRDHVIVLAACGTIFLSASGSGVVSIALVLLLAYWRQFVGISRWAVVALVAVAGSLLAVQVLASRGGSRDFSWGDRYTSIAAAFQHLAESNVGISLFGVGQSYAHAMFTSGQVSLSGYRPAQQIVDIFSTLGRVVFENGLLIGGIAVLTLLWVTFAAGRALLGTIPALGLVTIYIVIAGLTITYESAAFIWALPGLCLGLLVHHHDQRKRDT